MPKPKLRGIEKYTQRSRSRADFKGKAEKSILLGQETECSNAKKKIRYYCSVNSLVNQDPILGNNVWEYETLIEKFKLFMYQINIGQMMMAYHDERLRACQKFKFERRCTNSRKTYIVNGPSKNNDDSFT